LKIKSWLFFTFFQSEVLALAKYCVSCTSITYVFWRQPWPCRVRRILQRFFCCPENVQFSW